MTTKTFTKAVKEKIWVKVLLGGASGSGKTYSALRLATGLAKAAGSEIAAGDTENGRMLYYADEFDFAYLKMEEPYTPESYIELIDSAVEAGFKVLIIDSTTHEWNYCLETHDKMPGNSYTNWQKITPRHDAFLEKMLQAPIHIIATVRGKDEYVLEEKNGKQAPTKVGLGYKQRDGLEYDYTVTFNLAQDTHIANSMKDNTHMFEGRYEVLTEKDGEKLYEWANNGSEPVPKLERKKEEDISTVIEKIASTVSVLVDKGIETAVISKKIKDICGTANYKKIEDVSTAKKILEELEVMINE